MAVLEQMTPRHYQQLRLSLMDTTNDNSVDLGVSEEDTRVPT